MAKNCSYNKCFLNLLWGLMYNSSHQVRLTRHIFQHLCAILNFEKQVYALCALNISQPTRHTISTLPYLLNWLPHVSKHLGTSRIKNSSIHGERGCKQCSMYTLVVKCEKVPQSFPHCGSLDRPALHSLNNCIYIFWSTKCNLWNKGACNVLLERSWKYLFKAIFPAQKLSKFQLQKNEEKEKMWQFNDCKSWRSKESQWENDGGSFFA